MNGDSSKTLARLVALYLPQFHPVRENDECWGVGFTEWTNVAKAKPLFRGHWQPRLPADLGFYDLRVPEVREQQADMARAAGVEGFCYWHYWFGNGRRLLERPFQEVLQSGRPDFPFCLAWANQSWSGVWHGNPDRILMQQHYPGPADEEAHFAAVLPAFRDERYLKVDGKPLFALFDLNDHPDPGSFVRHWRTLARRAGLPGLYFLAMSSGKLDARGDCAQLEFDAVTEHGPGDFLQRLSRRSLRGKMRAARRGDLGRKINALVGSRFPRPQRYDYRDVVRSAFSDEFAQDERFIPTVLPGWDNTPRSGARGIVFEGSTPELFEAYVRKAVDLVRHKPAQERIIILKAWNEWAEGNYVEPDSCFGHRYLAALRRALCGERSRR
jgi:lipopolysaccharide biosynthesis protein